MRNKVFFSLLSLGFLAVTTLSAADPGADSGTEPKSPLVYAVYDQPPWVIEGRNDSGQRRGIMPSLVREITRRSPDIQIDLSLVPFRRGLVALREGDVDMAPTMDDPRMRAFATPIASFGHLQMSLFTREPVNLEDSPPQGTFRVGNLRGLPVPERLKSLPGLHIVPFNRGGSAIESLDRGHLDGVILADVGYRYYVEYFGWTYKHFHQARFLGNLPLYLWVRQEDAERPEFQAIARVMAEMAEDGTSQSIMDGEGVDFSRHKQGRSR